MSDTQPEEVEREDLIKFRKLFKVNDFTGCWVWLTVYDNGYGQFYAERKNWRAHRWAYREFVGPLIEGMQIGHKCDNKRCVNPEHLEQITAAQNTKDAFERGLLVPWASRLTKCPRGHSYPERDPDKSRRRCLECVAEWKASREGQAALARY